ncbi:hypothetical protein BX666DRAFT_2026862 [Dichotomocladium elegans]|nr:hypothetical protein BX666DRAFT_2026862 [Dichotomocladium elegans]
MKRSSFRDKDIALLYEYARDDLFLNPMDLNKPQQKLIMHSHQESSTVDVRQANRNVIKAPSITAIFLLELEVKLIQMISGLPAKPPKHVIFASLVGPVQHAVRWTCLFGLLVLDYVSRVLGVDNEMAKFLQQSRSDPIIISPPNQQQHHHNHLHEHGHEQPHVDLQVVHLESSEICVEEEQNSDQDHSQKVEGEHDMGKYRCTACTPSKLPVRTCKSSVPSRAGSSRSGHIRSLSNNMTFPARHASSLGHNHSLRRIDGQRNLASVNPSSASSSSSLSHHSVDHHCRHHHHHHQPFLAEPPRRSTSTHL